MNVMDVFEKIALLNEKTMTKKNLFCSLMETKVEKQELKKLKVCGRKSNQMKQTLNLPAYRYIYTTRIQKSLAYRFDVFASIVF